MKMKLINQKRLEIKIKNENWNWKSNLFFIFCHFVIILYHFKVNFVQWNLFASQKVSQVIKKRSFLISKIKLFFQEKESKLKIKI